MHAYGWIADGRAGIAAPGRGLRSALALAGAIALAACGDQTTEPEPEPQPQGPAAVAVSSPIGAVMAADYTVQLTAVASDAAGSPMSGQSFTWATSNDTVATVTDGLVRGLVAGAARITASTGGVSGSLDMQVVAADLDAIAALLGDPYTAALVAGLGDAARGDAEAALAGCDTALAAGHVLNLRDCLQSIQPGDTTDPTDRALLAVLGVIGLRAELFLGF